MRKRQEIEYLRSFDEATMDGALSVPELPEEYVAGYGSYWKDHHIAVHEETRLTPTRPCPEEKQRCEAPFIGFAIGGAVSPRALYQCKHGQYSFGLVGRIYLTYRRDTEIEL